MKLSPKEVHELARQKGFYADHEELVGFLKETKAPRHLLAHVQNTWIASRLALIHAEVSEALECVRKNELQMVYKDLEKPEGLPTELADVELRLADLWGALGLNRDAAIILKHQYNKTRPERHGGKKL